MLGGLWLMFLLVIFCLRSFLNDYFGLYQDRCPVVLPPHFLHSEPPDLLRSPDSDHHHYRRSLDRGLRYPYRLDMRQPLLSAMDGPSRLCTLLPPNSLAVLAQFVNLRFSLGHMDTFPSTSSGEHQLRNKSKAFGKLNSSDLGHPSIPQA